MKWLFTDNADFTILAQTDDAAGLMGFMLLTTTPADIIDSLKNTRIHVTVVLGSGLTADIG